MLKTKLTGVDSSTAFVLNFDKIEAQVCPNYVSSSVYSTRRAYRPSFPAVSRYLPLTLRWSSDAERVI
jgi:hypothetical protein